MEASNHVTISHIGHGCCQRDEDGQLICLLASKLGCTATFRTYQDLKQHVSSKHSGEKILCPVQTEIGCKRAYMGFQALTDHVRKKHRPHAFVCPCAESAKCTATFSAPWEVKEHVEKVHEKKRLPCPLAKEHDCNESFITLAGAREHARSKHLNVRYPCPLAEEMSCGSVFQTRVGANGHANTVHKNLRFPCPLDDCLATFTLQDSVKRHVDSVHKGLRFPCPLANEHNCPKTFSSSKIAKAHSHIHSGLKIPCPLAKDYGCDLMFKTQEYARNHKKLHTHPFICPRKDCFRRFQSFGDTLQHADDPNHQVPELFLCPVQMCRSATIGKPLSGHDIKWHRNLHVQLGHIDSTDFIPQAAKEQQLHSDIPLYSLIQQHERLDLTARSSCEELALGIHEDDGDSDVNETDLKDIYNAVDSDDNDHRDMQDDDKIQEAFPEDGELLQELECPSELLSQEHHQRVLQRNTAVYGMLHILPVPS